MDEHSLVHNKIELQQKCISILDEYGPLLVEEYIAGREFTVLVAANVDVHSCTVFKPVEYLFPKGREFKTYALKPPNYTRIVMFLAMILFWINNFVWQRKKYSKALMALVMQDWILG